MGSKPEVQSSALCHRFCSKYYDLWQGQGMNALRLPVKGEGGREKGAPCLFFRLVPGKNAVCIRSIIVGRRFYPSLFSLLPSRNRFMRLPCPLLRSTSRIRQSW